MPQVAHKSEGQKGAEAEVDSRRNDLGPFVVAAESSRMPMVFTNAREPSDRIIFANDSFLALTGYARVEVLGQAFEFLLAPNADEDHRQQLAAAFSGRGEDLLELPLHRKDGDTFWGGVFVSPVRDEAGAVVQHFASFVDLTRHIREKEHLRFLLDELNHRTQNTLATVLAIAGQTLRNAIDRQDVEAFEGRILALSKVHGILGRHEWLAVGLRELLDRILEPFGIAGEPPSRFTFTGADVRLDARAALNLAMVFHELATNAAKYGALSGAGAGVVAIAWKVEPSPQGDQLRLSWQESGGPAVAPPSRRGFGSRLIEGALADMLGGEVHLDYDPAGAACHIVMPLPKVAGD
ncbi:HWE histidine kinase domain-containing protein [Phenylobacterium sp.]|uniref:HWE histidine kinase domain-containing protein n=1 Tax=Phenylobacterium sp. TaxID=1871053 RepID=UPI002ED9AE27